MEKENPLRQVCTNFPKIKGPLHVLKLHKSKIKQGPLYGRKILGTAVQNLVAMPIRFSGFVQPYIITF